MLSAACFSTVAWRWMLVSSLFYISARGSYLAAGGAATSSTTTQAVVNEDCSTNVFQFVLGLEDVDPGDASFQSTMKSIIANAVHTAEECVTLDDTNGRRLGDSAVVSGICGVAPEVSKETVDTQLSGDSFIFEICKRIFSGPTCRLVKTFVKKVVDWVKDADRPSISVNRTTTTSTTTESPDGLPWWAWFLIFCGSILCCFLCIGSIGGAGAVASHKQQARAQPVSRQQSVPPVEYEVVEIPDEDPALAANNAFAAGYGFQGSSAAFVPDPSVPIATVAVAHDLNMPRAPWQYY
mmetsp:Transcript_54521/g.130024  ORF Transcript_54521/g.130024 Transcript_54521/m.130024 type:complete len:295 (+) Transcript_54521:64-948(+)